MRLRREGKRSAEFTLEEPNNKKVRLAAEDELSTETSRGFIQTEEQLDEGICVRMLLHNKLMSVGPMT